MKKITFVLGLIMMVVMSFFTNPAFALNECAGVPTSVIDCKSSDGAGAVWEIVNEVVNIMTIGVGILGVIGITVVGIQYMTARGNEQRTLKAKRRLLEIVIGLGVYAVLRVGAIWLLPGGSYAGDKIKVEKIIVGQESVSIQVGDKISSGFSVYPLEADNSSLKYTSSNAKVAKVNKNTGEIEAKSEGKATITATSSNDLKASMEVNVTKKTGEGGGGGGGGGEIGDTGNRAKFDNALLVMHADNNGNIGKVNRSTSKKYYAVECDYELKDSKMYCYHSGTTKNYNLYFNNGGKTATLEQTVTEAIKGGTKVVLDMKPHGRTDAALAKLAAYIQKNNLQNWVIIQIGYGFDSVMNKMKALLPNTKLEYWGLVGHVSDYQNNSKKFRDNGMTTVNIQDKYATDSAIKTIRNAGFKVCVYNYGSFSNNKWNADYLMVDDIDNQKISN